MGWKCIPQVIGLVRGEPKPGAKHRANGGKICKEAGCERASRSKTLDREKSKDNSYRFQESGTVCWDQMEQTAEEYRVTGTNKNGKAFSRKLRADAVIGWAMIIKPPMAVAATWSEAKKDKFRNDSWRAMMVIEPRLFRKGNVRMLARHRDEGGDHDHVIGEARDQDGAYCGNLVDFKLLQKINEQYPALMRGYGWDIEDAEVTDWNRYQSDLEYRDAVNAKKAAGPGGLSVNDYMAKQAAERAEQAMTMYQEAQATLQEAQEAREEARSMKSQADRVKATNETVTASQRALPGQHRSELEKQLQGI